MNKSRIAKLQEGAKKARNLFEYHAETGGRKEFYAFKMEVVGGDDELYRLFSETIHGGSLDEDSIFEYVVTALDHIMEEDPDSDLSDAVFEWADGDTDVYTSELTEWLNRSEKNVYYLTQATDEYGQQDGFKILQIAQMMAREEIYNSVIDVLQRFIAGADDDPDDEDDDSD